MSHLKTNPLKFNLPINQGFLQIYFIQKEIWLRYVLFQLKIQ